MKELRHLSGTVVLDDRVIHSLEKFGDALAAVGMAATVTIHTSADAAAFKVKLGKDDENGTDHVLHAKPVSGTGSHFDIGDH